MNFLNLNLVTLTLVGCCYLALCLTLTAYYFHASKVAGIFKPLASLCFIGLAFANGALSSSYGQLILVALMFAWLGDVILLGESRRFFLAGLLSFLVTHMMYIIGFYQRGFDSHYFMIGLVVTLLFSMLIACWLLPKVEKALKLPVIVYTLVIDIMVALAIACGLFNQHYTIVVGAILFYLSDLSVANERFANAGFFNLLWGLLFYYSGQLLIAMSVIAH